MNVLLTGGAGDLGTVLTPLLEARGDIPLRLDIVPPTDQRGVYLAGSILDRDGLTRCLAGVDSVVHMAAWHGIHATTRPPDVYAFWDLNVTGTFNVFEAAHQAGVTQVVYLSSTSVRHRASLYGHTKVLGEEIAQTYGTRHGMQVVTLRPRGFIPHWNRATYASFVEWLQWFWRGAVHIEDVAQAVVRSLDLLATTGGAPPEALVVDGAYEYTAADVAAWDPEGPGSTFKKYYATYYDLALRYSLQPAEKPYIYDLSETHQWLGYVPRYSLRHALEDLARYGPTGPPWPEGRVARPEA
jgi:nucleoside-diphosphate-sugar epimerase